VEAGTHRLEITYASPPAGQRVVLACNKSRIGEFELIAGGRAVERLSITVPLKAGSNKIQLAFRTWDTPECDDRALALKLVAVVAEPVSRSAVAA
jgi:hypothetical protein